MNTKEYAMKEMKIVHDITNVIIDNLRELTKRNAISVEDSVKIINIISDSQYEWMMSNFNPSLVENFVNSI